MPRRPEASERDPGMEVPPSALHAMDTLNDFGLPAGLPVATVAAATAGLVTTILIRSPFEVTRISAHSLLIHYGSTDVGYNIPNLVQKAKASAKVERKSTQPYQVSSPDIYLADLPSPVLLD
uniref:Uncharacterized protein n=1 Tax=Sphaerodactylus townsendi TaxID=933632 RepID=A0ACB8EA66_9SAUR